VTKSPEVPALLSPPAADSAPSPIPPALWALAGGKGGVGRTLLAANMGIQMARMGKRVAAVDLDFQGPSLHTYLGFSSASRTLEELLDKEEASLPSLLLDTSVSGLKLLAGVPRTLDAQQRGILLERFLSRAPSLPVDVVLVDCGSGRSPEILDLVRSSASGILVTTPEPAAFESLHSFAESLIQRVLECRLSAEDREKLAIAESLLQVDGAGRPSFRSAVERLRSEGAEACARITDALRPLRLRLILNQIRGDADGEVAALLRSSFEKFFGLELKATGTVEYDLSVLQSVQKRKPLAQQYPNSPATQGIERSVSALLTPLRDATEPPPLTRDLASLDHYRMLEVPSGATSKEIQQSYQVLKRAYDPDAPFRHPGLSSAEVGRVASLLENAYRTLIFLESRSEYDRALVEEGILRPEQVRPPEPEAAAPAPAGAPAASGLETVSPVPVSARDDSSECASGEIKAPGRGLPVTGATLREHREVRKLSLEAIVERTKIRPSILEALEADRFNDLPEPVFLRGFLRQLAVCLGLDPAVVSREYMERFLPSAKAPSKRIR
jgi:flagellar biosynthesis protein FlhG